jgi:hypothetical protein
MRLVNSLSLIGLYWVVQKRRKFSQIFFHSALTAFDVWEQFEKTGGD